MEQDNAAVKNPYRWGTMNHLKHALQEHCIGDKFVDNLRILVENIESPEEDRTIIMYDGNEVFGRAKYIDGIDQPLFDFSDDIYNDHDAEVSEEGVIYLVLRLGFSMEHGKISILIGERQATQNVCDYVSEAFLVISERPGYKTMSDNMSMLTKIHCGRKSVMVLFNSASVAQAFITYVNKSLKHYR